MKTTFCMTLLTLVMLTFVPNSFAQDTSPEYVVRVIYFLPNDRQPDPDMDTKLDTLITDIQKFYADQMEAHGFDRKTFRFEVDENGNAVVHYINGKYNDAYYQNPATGSWIVWDEIEEQFDTSKNIYFLALGISSDFLDGGDNIFGRASGSSLSGRALVPASNFGAAIHELGHAFGLTHDYRKDGIWISSPYTRDQMVTSFCAAQWLDAHRAFNHGQSNFNSFPKVEMLGYTLVSFPQTIRFRFKVTDTDGLHQVQLIVPEYPGAGGLLDCKGLNGKTSSTVEFVTTGFRSKHQYVSLCIIDVHGNYSKTRAFPIDMNSILPPAEDVLIPDRNLAAAIQEEIGDSITTHTMLSLIYLWANNRGITDLTGLEHAYNLERLSLADEAINGKYVNSNSVSDISPLKGLTQLIYLYLDRNSISDASLDASVLASLTQLKYLRLNFNNISDLSPLSELTQLTNLSLDANEISDLSPLTSLTQLTNLNLSANEISDLSPLTSLTQLTNLGLTSNTISDISLLSGFTQLEELGLGYNETISDVSPLAGLTQLKTLTINRNTISDVSPLAGHIKLRLLWLDSNQIDDVTPLAGLTNLRQLYLVNNQISDVSPLAGLINVETLRLVGNPIKNREPLFELLRKNPNVKIYLKDQRTPLPVNLSHFRAEHTDAGVLLKWTTESEVDNAGFYIYRSPTKDGEFKVVNLTMVQGAGTTGERNEYIWTDTSAKPNTVYYYQIEDISHAGVRKQLATVRLRGLISAKGKLTTSWADLKTHN